MSLAFVAAVASLSIGCDRREPTPPNAMLVGPFAPLDGVELGMTVAELRRIRPAIRFQPYTGLEESIGGYRVDYVIPGTEEDPPPDNSRIRAVRAARGFADSTVAMAEEGRLVLALGPKAKCHMDSADANRWRHALNWGRQEVTVSFARPTQDPYGRDTTTFALSLGWQVIESDRRLKPLRDCSARDTSALQNGASKP